tara:strand:+ start:232 stop:468 length:237 start_codon:yes stop_codon:yes gene_type:complete
MKMLSLSLLIIFFFACKKDNCGEIIDKVVEGNTKILVIRFDEGGGTDQGEFNGEIVDDIEVNDEIFSNFSEGEIYCVE